MRATSHCANHPSREAGLRCRSCGKWLCDRCTTTFQGRVFCGHKCRTHDLVSGSTARTVAAARRPVPAIWVVLAIGVANLAAAS